GVGSKAAALVDLSTVAGNKISNPPWVKFQSAGWVNFPSAPTLWNAGRKTFMDSGSKLPVQENEPPRNRRILFVKHRKRI
ncbi:hypothetical protein, partial [Pseudomonas aeruginosa]|uniref:hypothetical protein n=1 Tax=Pseudomonas aeruginosa TaxID=287 RepID=UPI003FD0688F